MKLVARLAVALAALALAVPVLACDGTHEKMKTTDKEEAKPAVATASEKTPTKAKPQAQKAKQAPTQAPASQN